MKTILLKLREAREIIKTSDLKKTGRNTFSKYDYYTPEQVEALVDKACKETDTIVLCNLEADEFGLYQTLDFINLEDETQKLSFKMRTKHGSIKATNETQQMGGTDTYSERYLKMKVFQIKDNNLDCDSQDNTKPAKPNEFTESLDKDLLQEIVNLSKKINPEITKDKLKDWVIKKTSEVFLPKNYNEIINKLTIISNE